MISRLRCRCRRDPPRLNCPRGWRFTSFSLALWLSLNVVVAPTARSLAHAAEAKEKTPSRSETAPQSQPADNPTSPARELSDYETESLNFALAEIQARLALAPEGKRVEAIEVVTLDVIEPRDPAPRFLNWFHVTTQKRIIHREVLLRVGTPYRQDLASETERNLREFAQFSVVLVHPVEGSTPDSVRVLVVTKDVWSLRTSWEPSFYNGRLTSIRLTPAESNLMGTTQMVGAALSLDANNYWLGASYTVPRIAGSRINGHISANAAFNCSSGDVEGGSGVAHYGQPLYSTRTKWSWRVAASYLNRVARPFAGQRNTICSGADPLSIKVPLGSERSANGILERSVGVVPYVYREEHLRSQLVLTRSFFVRNKLDISFGAESDRRVFSPLDEVVDGVRAGVDRWDEAQECWLSPNADGDCRHEWSPSEYSRVALSAAERDLAQRYYARTILRGDSRINPYMQLHLYQASYLRTINYNTIGLQEDVQLGHNVYLRLYPSFRPLASRDIMGLFASGMYTWPLQDGFVRVAASTLAELSGETNELQNIRPGQRQSEAEVQLHAHVASPDLGIGRVVMGAAFADRPISYLDYERAIGGADRLRGYEPAAFQGRTYFVNNTEFRARPLQLFSILFGLSAFWDMGHVANGVNQLRLRHGVGGGLRVLFPQLDRQVFRLDVGFPAQNDPAGSVTFTAGFRQAFDAPVLYPNALLTQ